MRGYAAEEYDIFMCCRMLISRACHMAGAFGCPSVRSHRTGIC